jgi:hypothetical protein
MAKHPKRPRDVNQLAKLIADIATGEKPTDPLPAASPMGELGRAGGLKGGKARAAALTPEQRSAIAKRAAAKRWAGKT